MEYIVKYFDKIPDWEKVEPIKVTTFSWGGDYRPYVEARVIVLSNKGFMVRMDCEEANPKAVYTQMNSAVCKDSCLEAFINFKPNLENSGYINFETNVKGALHSAYGQGRHNRQFLTDMGINAPIVFNTKDEDKWSCEYLIPFKLIREVYGDDNFKKGDVIKANFYKCGDKLQTPHFLSWNPIGLEKPNFHCPEFFGTLNFE